MLTKTQMTFFVMNLACFLLKIGSAPNFRPGFKFFSWQTAFAGSLFSAGAMFFIDETYATTAVCMLVFLFLLIHYLSPPKHWGDVSQNLIYHQVRKYLLRLKPEHIKFWRPQIILLINNPRKQTRLIQFCNSMKKGALYILGHVIVNDDFSAGVAEAKLQQAAWTKYISEYSRIKAFVQLTMSPSITWGVRNLILSAGLGGMRPNIAVIGFYNMHELRNSQPKMKVPEATFLPTKPTVDEPQVEAKSPRRRRGDTSARLLEGFLPTDVIRNEEMMSATDYMTILEDMALRYRLNVAIAKGFETLEIPRKDGGNTRKYIDLWPIQMSAEISAEGRSVLTTNFDTCKFISKSLLVRPFVYVTMLTPADTLILQLGYILHTVPAWKKAYNLRVLVFVEYESEVEEERGRVKALLEKLRIEAELLVFWLASGDLSAYEMIIHGKTDNPDTEKLVNDCLEEQEWWKELQSIRGSQSMSSSQELANISHVFESTMGGNGTFSSPLDTTPKRRRSLSHLSDLRELPKKPTISRLARLGVNMGIHTQYLPVKVLQISDYEDDDGSDSESESSEDSIDGDFNDTGSVVSDGDMDSIAPNKVPLLAAVNRRKSYNDILSNPRSLFKMRSSGKQPVSSSTARTYGTVTQVNQLGNSRPESTSQRVSPDPSRTSQAPSRTEKPTLSRHGSTMKFSSTLVPETMITHEGDSEPRIMFADDESRPFGFSRESSFARLPNNSNSEADAPNEEGGPKGGQKVSFADFEIGSPARSRRSSFTRRTGNTGDTLVDIPELLASYESNGRQSENDGEGAAGSSYSTQGLPLSFNDLPSRAQHLILNELMRQNSEETAVLFTTLPIPEENTCQSEEASLAYLSNIEVLCDNLPPVLLVLSNNMTVTVSL